MTFREAWARVPSTRIRSSRPGRSVFPPAVLLFGLIVLAGCGAREVGIEPPGTQTIQATAPATAPGASPAAASPKPAASPSSPAPTPTAFGGIDLPRSLYFLVTDLASDGHKGSVWRLDPGGTQVVRVTPPELDILSFDVWDGDGRVAYATETGQVYWAMPKQEPRLLYDAAGQANDAPLIESLAWSPSGDQLAFALRHLSEQVKSDGLWLLTLGDETATKLLDNRYLDPSTGNVNDVRVVTRPVWSPDGSALLLTGQYWEWTDMLWLEPLVPDPSEANLHDPPGDVWLNGSWTRDGRLVLLSGIGYSQYGDLALVGRDTGESELLISGEAEGLFVHNAHELRAGVTFLASGAVGPPDTRLYVGSRANGAFTYAPAGPDRGLCSSGYVREIAWDPAGELAVICCDRGAELISLDGTVEVDLEPFLGPLGEGYRIRAYWGPALATAPPAGPTPTPSPQGGGWSTFTSAVFAVTFQHPTGWQPDPAYSLPETGDTRYAGDDGFFIVGAMGGADLDAIAASVANHRLLPYGTAPTVERLTIQGQPARLIRPSEDQYPGMMGQAELIVTYPRPVTIGGHAYGYFSLAADRDHILSIAQTLGFTMGGESPPPPTPVETLQEPGLEVQQPEIVTFTVSPDDRLDFGDTVTVRWSVVGAMQSLFCYRYGVRLTAEPGHDLLELGGECFGGVPAECHARGVDGNYLYAEDDERCAAFLPAEGAQEVVLAPLDEGEVYYVTFWLDALSGTPDPQERYGLRAPIYEDRASVSVPVTCVHEWFMRNRPRWCPADPPWSNEVTAQAFENGIMLYVPAHDSAPSALHAFYSHEGQIRQATSFAVSPAGPDSPLVAPAGLRAPDDVFYTIWDAPYGRTSLRETMGWATGEPFPFTWMGQYEQGPDSWDAHYVNMPDGTVLRYHHIERVWTVWE